MKKFRKLLTLIVALAMMLTSMSIVSYADSKDVALDNFLLGYYNVMYQGYLSMAQTDIEQYYDTSIPQNQNEINSYKNLLLRRRLIDENGYCYVEKSSLPYSINVISTSLNNNIIVVKYEVVGLPEKAYPPFIVANCQVKCNSL